MRVHHCSGATLAALLGFTVRCFVASMAKKMRLVLRFARRCSACAKSAKRAKLLASCNILAIWALRRSLAKKAANKSILIVYHAQDETSIQCASARIAAIRTPSCSRQPSQPANGPAAHARAPPAPDARSADGRRRPRFWPRERTTWLSDRQLRNRLDRRRKNTGCATHPDLRGHARHWYLCGVGPGRGRP